MTFLTAGIVYPRGTFCENRISIEEAIALYMQTAAQIVTPPVRQPVKRDTAQHSQPDDAQVAGYGLPDRNGGEPDREPMQERCKRTDSIQKSEEKETGEEQAQHPEAFQ